MWYNSNDMNKRLKPSQQQRGQSRLGHPKPVEVSHANHMLGREG